LSSATSLGYVNAQRLTRASDVHPGDYDLRLAVPLAGLRRGTQYSAEALLAPAREPTPSRRDLKERSE